MTPLTDGDSATCMSPFTSERDRLWTYFRASTLANQWNVQVFGYNISCRYFITFFDVQGSPNQHRTRQICSLRDEMVKKDSLETVCGYVCKTTNLWQAPFMIHVMALAPKSSPVAHRNSKWCEIMLWSIWFNWNWNKMERSTGGFSSSQPLASNVFPSQRRYVTWRERWQRPQNNSNYDNKIAFKPGIFCVATYFQWSVPQWNFLKL